MKVDVIIIQVGEIKDKEGMPLFVMYRQQT
jgi:hypothetical protein